MLHPAPWCMSYFCSSSYFLRSTFLYSAWLLQSCKRPKSPRWRHRSWGLWDTFARVACSTLRQQLTVVQPQAP